MHRNKLTLVKRRTLLITTAISTLSLLPKGLFAHDELPSHPERTQPEHPRPERESASIRLTTEPLQSWVWTVVQWQGGDGRWHDVQGWQGSFNHPEYVSWRVDQNEFGKGPFRWVVFENQRGGLLGVSEDFYLPTIDNEILEFSVTLTSPEDE